VIKKTCESKKNADEKFFKIRKNRIITKTLKNKRLFTKFIGKFLIKTV